MIVESVVDSQLTGLQIQAVEMAEIAIEHPLATKHRYSALLSALLPVQRGDHLFAAYSPACHSYNLLSAMRS